MTKKRFTKIKDPILNEGEIIIDNEKKYTFSILNSRHNHMFCKALNELHEENEQLRDINTRCCNEYSYFHKQMIKLEKENKELKKELGAAFL